MISYIKGELTEVSGSVIVVETAQGVGMNIVVPDSVISRLPVCGSIVKIFTYLGVKEDSLTLYGFLNRDDLNIFKLLIGVNGIGPKGALGILSALTPDDLRFAVLSGDVKAISRAPGIGTKTAQRMIIELKDKLSLEDAFEIKLANEGGEPTTEANAGNDAVLALEALGYGRSEAVRAVSRVENADALDGETLLKEALKKLI